MRGNAISRRTRALLLCATGLLALSVSYMALPDLGVLNTPLGSACVGGNGAIAFDGKTWKDADGYPAWDNRRERMAKDLVRRYLRPGMARKDVENLLGRPEAGNDETALYSLIRSPRLDQRAIAWLRWGTSDPILVLLYDSRTGILKSATVKKW